MSKFIICVFIANLIQMPVFAEVVNVYSARKEILIKPLLDKFTDETGVRVNLLTGKADALIKRLEVEGKNSPADLFITTDAGRLYRTKMMKLLQPVESKLLQKLVPEQMRDPDHQWYGLSVRPRPIMFAKGRVKKSDLSTYENLVEQRWKGRICVSSSSSIYNQSLVASMISANGETATTEWAKGLVANMARTPAGGDIEQIKMLAAGQCDIAIANTYYLGIMSKGRNKKYRRAAKKISIFWPNQKGRGTHVNISGVGVVAASKNQSNAIKLIEHMLSEESQAWYARVNFEYPVRDQAEISKLLKQWGEFKSDNKNISLLGKNNSVAVKAMDRAGWR